MAIQEDVEKQDNNDDNTQSPQDSSTYNEEKAAPKAPEAPATQSAKRNSLVIPAFILAFIFPIVGLIMGIIALSKIKKSNEQGKECDFKRCQ